ncbi:MAG: Crp/Fnr family transcriptional regulator [Thermonemataceae bacterium]
MAPLNKNEIHWLETFFEPDELSKGTYLLEVGQVCKYIFFINKGLVRHGHIDEKGQEITCDFTCENEFLTDYLSFNQQQPSEYFFKAMEEVRLLKIERANLQKLYALSTTFEQIGRKVAEKIAVRVTAMAQSLITDKAETRFLYLLQSSPTIFQRVPYKYIASYLGMKPETLSRIRKKIQQREKS